MNIDFVGIPLELDEVYVRDVECDMVRRRECDAKIQYYSFDNDIML